DPEELREFLYPILKDDSIIDDYVLRDRNLPVAHSESELYFEFPIITDTEEFVIEYVSFICMPTLLITIHRNEVGMMSRLASSLCDNLHLKRATIASLLYYILAELIEKNYALYMALREDITDLSNRVIAEKLTIDINAILNVKKNVDRVNIMVEDQLYCINILNVYDGTAFDIGKLGKSFKNLEEEIRNGFRFLSRYERRLEDLHQHYDLMLQDKTNNRLKILTIVAAIFLPLNLVAGIYGMNFDNMPILHWDFAYHTILFFMAAVAIVMVYFFYRAGWFK
ncbi:MAG: hypothetical protein KJ002_01215, partial [Candidatus Dadabacteria bacterium]|nr:hypothetical protein [Candidatus Dadabacteria bacterium]